MRKEEEILMLSIIENSGNIRKLLRANLSYREISELMNKLVQDKLLTYVGTKIVLTEKGKKDLKNYNHLIKKTIKENWIEPENKSRVKKYERNFIYLPNQTELDF